MAKKATPKKAARPRAKKADGKKPKSGRAKAVKSPKPVRSARQRKGRSTLRIQTQHIDFMTYKVDQLRKFYGEVLELQSETRDTEGLNYLLVTTSPSSTIGFMPPHPEMREQPLPREPTLYFEVRDVDRAYAQLTAKGAAFMGPPQEMPWGHRVVTTTDPEGRAIMLASKVKKRKKKEESQ